MSFSSMVNGQCRLCGDYTSKLVEVDLLPFRPTSRHLLCAGGLSVIAAPAWPAMVHGPSLAARRHSRRAAQQARRHPGRETLELAAAGAAQVLGPDHGATKALARASITMAKADLWRARLAIKTLRHELREAIAEVAES